MNIYTIFTDCLFMALHLIPLAVSYASDLSVWFSNRFCTNSDTCQNVEYKKETLVFRTPKHTPLLLPPASPEARHPHLSASTSRSTREQTASTYTSIWKARTHGSTPSTRDAARQFHREHEPGFTPMDN